MLEDLKGSVETAAHVDEKILNIDLKSRLVSIASSMISQSKTDSNVVLSTLAGRYTT
jgi:hypothetical protein